jgi:hypothetical protein
MRTNSPHHSGPVFVSLLIPLLAGCTTYSESYYVGVTTGKYGEQMEPAQFYRFDLRGTACFTRSEFQSGWYDRDAVDVLFSEVVTETSKRNTATGGAVAATIAVKPLSVQAAPSASYVVFGPEGELRYGENKRFVIIAASNPKAIADEIQSFADSQDLSSALTDLLQREEREKALGAHYEAEKEVKKQATLLDDVAEVKKFLTELKKTPTKITTAHLQEEVDRILKAIPQ